MKNTLPFAFAAVVALVVTTQSVKCQDQKPAEPAAPASAAPAPSAAAPAATPAPDAAPAASGGTAKIILGVLPAVMQFDKKALTVKAGDSVEMLFTNKTCPLQHNFILCKPGTDNKVGAAADALMIKDAAGAMAKAYIPDDPEGNIVAKSTKLIGLGQNEVIKFTAPAPGSYPYICTFPAHRYLMKGVLTVTP